MSAQQLADRCAALGMPGITRPVLVKLEHGRRESVSTAELAILAAALGLPPLLLLLPVGDAECADYLPGRSAPPLDAARWWTGEAALGRDGAIDRNDRAPVTELFAEHQRLVSDLPDGVTEADYRTARARHSPGRSRLRQHEDPAQTEMMYTVITLREIRGDIRELGTEPPQLPPALKWLDREA